VSKSTTTETTEKILVCTEDTVSSTLNITREVAVTNSVPHVLA
jgi:hypothetical protein